MHPHCSPSRPPFDFSHADCPDLCELLSHAQLVPSLAGGPAWPARLFDAALARPRLGLSGWRKGSARRLLRHASPLSAVRSGLRRACWSRQLE